MRKASAVWKVATIRGVDLKFHVSLIFLMVYVILVAGLQFPYVALQTGIDPSALSFRPVIWGALFAIGLLFSVVIHELGHVWVAQAQGVRVRGITLMMLGGASEMERIPDKPYSEFKLAIVGPLVSFALAAILFLIRANTQSLDLAFFSRWLGGANLVLGIFNLLPAFPLDGGRALRSVLAARKGMLRGTRAAVRVSRVFAWVLGIWGLLTFNVLLALIAFYIYSLAQGELVMLTTRRLLEGLKISEVVSRTPPIDERAPLREAAEQMLRLQASVLPVAMLSGVPALVTLEGLRRFPRSDWGRILVRDAVDLVSRNLTLDEPVSQVLPELSLSPAGALPVKGGGQIVGIVRNADLDQVIQFRSLEDPKHLDTTDAA